VLTAGVNLYALALVINALMGWQIWLSIAIGLHSVGGYGGLKAKIGHTSLGASAFSTWGGVVLSFGYWTTNFAEVQRALSAKDLSAAQRTPLAAGWYSPGAAGCTGRSSRSA